MTKAVDYVKIINEFNPNAKIIQGFDKHILSIAIKEDTIEIFCSFWGVVNELMSKENLTYTDSVNRLIEIVGKENLKRSDITYFFYDDLPNPQLN